MALVSLENVDEVVRYHAPDQGQINAHEVLAQSAENFIRAILEMCPPCADQTAAIRKVREAKMTASASIALKGMI